MTRWNNTPVSTSQEIVTDFLLTLAATTAILLSVGLQQKRRAKEIHDGQDLPLEDGFASNNSKCSVWNKKQAIAAVCNISTLLVSMIYLTERYYTLNPYVQNRWLIAVVAFPFGCQLFRLLRLAAERSPDIQSELILASKASIFQRISRKTNVHPVNIVLFLPSVLIAFLWTFNFHWLPADILCLANTVMLTVDLSKFQSLKTCICFMFLVVGMISLPENFRFFAKCSQTLSRSTIPLGLSLPTSSALSTFLSVGSLDVVVIGIFISLLRKLDVAIASNKTGDGRYYAYSSYFIASIIGFNVGMALGFFVGFGLRTTQSLLVYSMPCSLLFTLATAAYRSELKFILQFRTKRESFKIC